MKVKQRPEDFVVVEEADLAPGERGAYALYRLTKRHIGTFEAVAALSHAWNVPRRRVGFCGLKDHHGLTTQFVTVEGGPSKGHESPQFEVEYLGRVGQPAHPRVLRGNRFSIVVRDLSRDEAEEFRRGLDEVREGGVPNYFDEQRFGSATEGEFLAKRLLAEDYEGALRLAIAPEKGEAPARRRKIRNVLRYNWGKWDECAAKLPRCTERSIVTYLKSHPTGFAHAFELLEDSYRFLLISAYQSFLWNHVLARLIEAAFPAERIVRRRIEHWEWPFPTGVTKEEGATWGSRAVPLPAPKMEGCAPEARAAVDAVLAAEGLEASKLRFKRLRKSYFGRGGRPAWLVPARLESREPVVDELNEGRFAVGFECSLPKGSYATLITRRLLGTWKRGKRVD